jgi:hypothetical protein
MLCLPFLGLVRFGLIRPFQTSFRLEKLSSLESGPELFVSTRNKKKSGPVRSFPFLHGPVGIRIPYHLDQILGWIEWSTVSWPGTVSDLELFPGNRTGPKWPCCCACQLVPCCSSVCCSCARPHPVVLWRTQSSSQSAPRLGTCHTWVPPPQGIAPSLSKLP